MKATPLKPLPQKFNLISRRCAFDPLRLNICKTQSETQNISISFYYAPRAQRRFSLIGPQISHYFLLFIEKTRCLQHVLYLLNCLLTVSEYVMYCNNVYLFKFIHKISFITKDQWFQYDTDTSQIILYVLSHNIVFCVCQAVFQCCEKELCTNRFITSVHDTSVRIASFRTLGVGKKEKERFPWKKTSHDIKAVYYNFLYILLFFYMT